MKKQQYKLPVPSKGAVSKYLIFKIASRGKIKYKLAFSDNPNQDR